MTRLSANDCDISALGTLGYFAGGAIADGGLTRVGFLHCREGKTWWTRRQGRKTVQSLLTVEYSR
ncbi:hypothetical protein [Anabaena sp. CS-542/02]|uniref:hypothetical protein n=1 Tax=Anabaena sp. CS-542/02 TaxID=3021719 RepID=UPI00232D123B|nr:hypothetical protein [Anabaena sp. CS-542/02]MDB9448184.1 hypothetical protein [Anabaena sp. CS-542/02]